jgi:hypothetical protein
MTNPFLYMSNAPTTVAKTNSNYVSSQSYTAHQKLEMFANVRDGIELDDDIDIDSDIDFSERMFHIGDSYDVLDSCNNWLESVVVGVDGDDIIFHYDNYNSKWDETIDRGSRRIAPLGKYTKGQLVEDYSRLTGQSSSKPPMIPPTFNNQHSNSSTTSTISTTSIEEMD